MVNIKNHLNKKYKEARLYGSVKISVLDTSLVEDSSHVLSNGESEHLNDAPEGSEFKPISWPYHWSI